MTPKELAEIVAGIDYHLKRMEEFGGELREVKMYMEQLRISQDNFYKSEFEKMKLQLEIMTQEFQKRGLPAASQYETSYQSIKSQMESMDWPMAVDPETICDTPQKAAERASNILSLVVGDPVKGKKFLDYGCGEGHVVANAIQRGAFAHGYDLNSDQSKAGDLVTTHLDGIKAHGPYDMILAHDVLDHLVVLNPVEALLEMKGMLASDGKIYVRCHPWSARHGGHLYMHINKAFLHLAMDEVELMRSGGYKSEHNIKVVRPLETYRKWFEKAGLVVASEMPSLVDVEDYYFVPSVLRDRILKHWDGSEMDARENMRVDFVEYVLRHPPRDLEE